ncbi:MAG TPA: aspartyl protease family protein [Gemmatimonadaceae bacterium]|nr:aspartyl protease family protein [Gemmatimonadaceae bacterium]
MAVVAAALACTHAGTARLAAPVVVPFEERGGIVLLNVGVNEHRALLILDTGSGAMVLDSAFADTAQVEFSSTSRGTANGNPGTSVRIASARKANVGAATLSNVVVAVANLDAVRARIGYDVHGALGFDVFNRYVVEVDYAAHTVTLTEPGSYIYQGGGAVLPVDISKRVPLTTASVVTRTKGVVEGRFLLDLGSSGAGAQTELPLCRRVSRARHGGCARSADHRRRRGCHRPGDAHAGTPA